MRKDIREFIRPLKTIGLPSSPHPATTTSSATASRSAKPTGCPFTLPFSPDATRWRKTAIIDLRKLGIDV